MLDGFPLGGAPPEKVAKAIDDKMADAPHTDDEGNIDWLSEKTGGVVVKARMSTEEVEMMVEDLVTLTTGADPIVKKLAGAPALFSWNGAGFDFRVIADEAPKVRDAAISLCARSFDPMLQIVQTFGFPLALNRVSTAMLGLSKSDGMDGKRAVSIWPIAASSVIRYCHGDTVLTERVVEAIREEKAISWINRKGKRSSWKLKVKHPGQIPAWQKKKGHFSGLSFKGWGSGFKNVAACIQMGQMEGGYLGPSLDDLVGWMNAGI